MRKNFTNKKVAGFSLIETLMYIFITAMLLTTISSLLMSNFNIRKQLKTSSLIYNDARFIMTQLNNHLHSVAVIEDVRPDIKQVIFYPIEDARFSLQVENDNLIFREVFMLGGDPPIEMKWNSERVRVSNFVLTPIDDNKGNEDRGLFVTFTLSAGDSADPYGYLSEDFQTFISLR